MNDKFNIKTNDFLYVNLNYYNKTINNDYFIVLKNDLKEIIEDITIVDFYFPKDLETKIKLTTTQYNSIYDNFKLSTYKENIFNNKSISINECYYEDIIFETLSDQLNINYNLAQIFNNLTTTFYNPVIKYFSNGIEKNIKLHKAILKKYTVNDLSKLINNKNKDSYINKLNSVNNLDYIQFIWQIPSQSNVKNAVIQPYKNKASQSTQSTQSIQSSQSKKLPNNHITLIIIYFYENGYMITHFNTNNIKIKIDNTLNGYFDYLTHTIKQIKKIINIKHLKLPNLSILLNESSKMINYSNLVKANISVNGKIDILKYQTDIENKKNNNTLNNKLFIERVRKHIT